MQAERLPAPVITLRCLLAVFRLMQVCLTKFKRALLADGTVDGIEGANIVLSGNSRFFLIPVEMVVCHVLVRLTGSVG